MIFVGIDVAKDKHDCFILNSEGTVLADVFTITDSNLNHTGIYLYSKGKIMIHLTFDYKTDEKCITPGQYLKYHRTFQGLSTRELAEKVGIVPATLVLYENDRHPIKYSTAVALAELLLFSKVGADGWDFSAAGAKGAFFSAAGFSGWAFAHAEKSMGQLAVRLDAMREELHQAGDHIKNAGFALAGKEPQESKELSADKGVLAKLRSFVLYCGKAFSEMDRDTALTVERINGGRSSVKTELQGLKSAQTGQRRQAASKEQAR